MRIHTVVSESHRPLLALYEESLRRVEPDADLVVHGIAQHGTGAYFEEDFRKAMEKRLAVMRRVAAEEAGPYLWTDCDIVWLRPFLKTVRALLVDEDGRPCFQKHGVEADRWACMGLYAVFCGRDLVDVLDKVAGLMPHHPDDEQAMREYNRWNDWPWEYLPDIFWTQGILGRMWHPGDPLDAPADAVCVHASWTVGVESKLAMMREVMERNTA